MARFRIYYTTEPKQATYPAGTVESEERQRWTEWQMSNWLWRDDARQRETWLELGNAFDTDGVPISVERGHFIEVETLDQLLAIVAQFGKIILDVQEDIGYAAIEIYNDYRE